MERIQSNVSSLDVLAKTIAVPRLHKPLRTPTFPSLEKTAVLSFTDTGTRSVPAGATGYYLLVRHPAYPLWNDRVMGDLGAGYTTMNASSVGFAVNGSVVDIGESELEMFGDWGSGITPIIRHENNDYFLVGGRISDGTPSPAPYPYRLGIQATVASGVMSYADVEVRYLRSGPTGWNLFEGDAALTLSVAGNQVGAVLDIPDDVFAFRVNQITWFAGGTAGTIQNTRFGVTTTLSTATTAQKAQCLSNPVSNGQSLIRRLMPAFPPPAIGDSAIPYEATRATAAAVLLSNVTAVLNKEGTVEAARAPVSSFEAFQPLKWDFGSLQPSSRYFGPLEKGLYVYSLADAKTDQFSDCVRGNYAIFDTKMFDYVTMVKLVDFEASSTSNMAITLDRHIEFRCSSQLFPTGYAPASLEAYHTAQLALIQMGTMMENPAHLATIASMAHKAIQAAMPVLRPLAAHYGQKMIASAANWANKKLGNMTQSAPGAQPPRVVVRKKPAAKRAQARRRTGRK